MLRRWGTEFDLAVVASEPPSIDAFETLRQIRTLLPGLPSIVLGTAPDDSREDQLRGLAIITVIPRTEAIGSVARRAEKFARDALLKTREQIYLDRIKARHERVLARFRALPRS